MVFYITKFFNTLFMLVKMENTKLSIMKSLGLWYGVGLEKGSILIGMINTQEETWMQGCSLLADPVWYW